MGLSRRMVSFFHSVACISIIAEGIKGEGTSLNYNSLQKIKKTAVRRKVKKSGAGIKTLSIMVLALQWNMVNTNSAVIRGSLCHRAAIFWTMEKWIRPATTPIRSFHWIKTNCTFRRKKFHQITRMPVRQNIWHSDFHDSKRLWSFLVQITVPALWLVYFTH